MLYYYGFKTLLNWTALLICITALLCFKYLRVILDDCSNQRRRQSLKNQYYQNQNYRYSSLSCQETTIAGNVSFDCRCKHRLVFVPKLIRVHIDGVFLFQEVGCLSSTWPIGMSIYILIFRWFHEFVLWYYRLKNWRVFK